MAETGARKWVIVGTVILASVIELIDTSIVNVALPHMMGNLSATLDEVAWVITSYVVANVIVVPMTGWLSQRFGRRNYFAGSIILFTTASFFCGQATTIWELVIFRLIQGIGGGALLSTSQSIMVETFPPEELGLANGLFGLGVVMGPTLGPTLGGWITDNFSWRWIFYINIPIGTLAALCTFTFIKNDEHAERPPSTDWIGIALLVLGIGALQIFLERGEAEDWFATNYITILLLISIIGIIAFIYHELTVDHPIVNLRVLKNPSLALGASFNFILGFGLYGSVFILPVFAQNLLGFTPTQTGIVLLRGAVATAIMMPLVGKLLQRGAPPYLLTTVGFCLVFTFTFRVSQLSLAAGEWDFFWPLIIRGMGMSMSFVPMTTLALSSLRGPAIAQGAGFTNMMRQLGGSFGVALVATFIQRRMALHRVQLLQYLTPYDAAFQERFQAINNGLASRGGGALAQIQQQSYAAVDGILMKQSALLSYLDAFRVMGLFFLFCAPLFFIFAFTRRGGGGPAPNVAAH